MGLGGEHEESAGSGGAPTAWMHVAARKAAVLSSVAASVLRGNADQGADAPAKTDHQNPQVIFKYQFAVHYGF